MHRPTSDHPSRPARRRDALRTLAGAALAATTAARAQDTFPSRPITLIVPWPAGGSTDRHLRGIAEIAARHLGQPIVVDNRPGAGGTLGPSQLAGGTVRPDGHTIAQYPLGMLRVPHMQKVAWHPINDFTFIVGLSGYTFGFVVRTDSPHKTFADYIAAAKREPGKIDYGSTGTGTSPHLLIEEIADAAGVQLNHVPYKGNADLMQAVVGGHVMAASDATGWDKLVEAGRLRLLVTFGDKRTTRWPDVPTARELGYNVVAQSPYGLVGPKGMDPAVVAKLHDAFRRALDDPKHVELLAQLNQDVWYRSPQDYRAWAQATFVKDRALIERLGLAAK